MLTHTLSRVTATFRKVAIAAGVLAGMALAPTVSEAAPIGNASFGIGGAFTLPAGEHLGSTNSIFISNGGMITVSAADTMDLAGLVTLGMTGTLQDLPDIAGFTPINSFISLSGGVSVDLSSLIIVGQSGPAPGFINLVGDAVIHAPGFDATAGLLTFTGTSADNTSFTLAVTTTATTGTAVPEPLSLALLGLGLMVLFVMARRRTDGPSMGMAA